MVKGKERKKERAVLPPSQLAKRTELFLSSLFSFLSSLSFSQIKS